jgi:hypothetical protein
LGVALIVSGVSRAAIVYVDPADLQVIAGGLSLNIDGEGENDVGLFTNIMFDPSRSSFFQGLNGDVNRVLSEGAGLPQVSLLFSNRFIGQGARFEAIAQVAGRDGPSGPFYGTWAPHEGPVTGFTGFRFLASDGLHFGWLRMTVGPGLLGTDFVVHDWAYESVAGEPIFAGQVPAPAGALPLGALALAGRRSRSARRD